VAHTCVFRGDGIIVLPKFDLKAFLNAIQTYKINQLILVCSPPPAGYSPFWTWALTQDG
jgi:hypothetical protein